MVGGSSGESGQCSVTRQNELWQLQNAGEMTRIWFLRMCPVGHAGDQTPEKKSEKVKKKKSRRLKSRQHVMMLRSASL